MSTRVALATALLLLALAGGCDLAPAPPPASIIPDHALDMVIVTHEDFLEALQPLAAHKTATGIRTHVQSWQAIDAAYASRGRDAPERIKRALADYTATTGIRYVMLVGDSDRLPVRYCKATNTEWGTKYYPSDLYYADLLDARGDFDAWDGNGNGVLCEMDFAGGTDIVAVNLDAIDMRPDLMVGRVPASTVAEVTTYVGKVIGYEFGAYAADWSRRALLVVDGGPKRFGDVTRMKALANALSGFTVLERYQDDAPYAAMDPVQRGAVLSDDLNDGVGLVFYYGHGHRLSWTGWFDDGAVAGLSNGARLPIVFASSCYTGRFHTDLEYYLGSDGVEWDRRFGPTPAVAHPQPMPVQGAAHDGLDDESLAEHFLVRGAAGAVAYIGSTSKVEHGIWVAAQRGLAHAFAQAYAPGATLGGMWRAAQWRFIEDEVVSEGMGWYRFIHIHKVMLFGDPSLRVGGISPIQTSMVSGTYEMVHDGWRGTLILEALPDDPIESRPNLGGTWTDAAGTQHAVRGYLRTWRYPLDPSFGPDHALRLFIDFPDTLDPDDDQEFPGLFFTQSRDAFAGVTAWHGVPFGFYARRTAAGASHADPHEVGVSAVGKADFLGTYRMNHDGWLGTLTLWASPDDPIEQKPNVVGSYQSDLGGPPRSVRGFVRTSTYPIDATWGPDHKIELSIDLPGTPTTADDQAFEGYLFTQTRNAMAGITWWHGTPFGFYAVKQVE
jgi:hypothetical protein